MKKRVVSMLLAVCLCAALAVPAHAAETTLRLAVPDELPAVGETFEAALSVSENPGLGVVQLTLTFDQTVLECTGISLGDPLKGALAATNPSAPDGARLAAASATALHGDGVLATYTFKVLADGVPAFALNNVILAAVDGSDVPAATEIPNGIKPETPEAPETPEVPKEPEAPEAPETPQNPAQPEPPEEPEEQPQLPAQPSGGPSSKPKEEESASQTFTDVPDSHWASSYIEKAADMGIIRGYADGTFRPGNRVTRAQFVTMLWRMAGSPESSGETPFTDIANVNAEFKAAIAWAYEKGYINGRTATTFAPSDSLSRQAAMKILFLHAGGKSGQEVLFTAIYNDRFTDSAGLPDWARTSLYWAVYNELISGTTPTTLGAGDAATRGQLAKILVNYAEKIGANKGEMKG